MIPVLPMGCNPIPAVPSKIFPDPISFRRALYVLTKIAAIAAQVMMFVIGIAGAVLSGGVGSSVQALSGTARTLNVGINALTGFNSICTGSVGIASSVVNYQIENLRADSKDLEAILMRIQTASDLDSKNIEDILKKCENMSQSVREVLDSCNQALGAVVTAAPSMA